jgi:glycosyltransferase involved in cell wall biosynthesis
MRIVICRSNPVAPDPRVEKEARALTKAGYTVQVLGWDRTAALPVEEERDGFQIHRVPVRANYGTGMGNLPKLIAWQVRQFSWLFSHRHDFDILHACDFDTVMPCMIIKLMFGKKLVYDIFDFYPDHLRGIPSWLKNILRSIDYWMINRADGVILVDDSRREQIKETIPKRLTVIYNSPENSLAPKTKFPPSVPGRLRLAYVGIFQRERGLFEVLTVAQRHPEWELDLAGFGGDMEAIQSASRELTNVRWHGTVPYRKALALSAQADVLFATYDPSVPNHRYSSPNKLFEAMMLAKPIVVARDTNMDRMVLQNECGIIVTYGDVPELENAFQQLADHPAHRKLLGENARKAYESLYNWDIMKTRLLSLYSETLQTNG